jgi:hypothetical protein
MRVSAGTRAGRSHRARDGPCQDSTATWASPHGGRAAAAVADGLGSRPLSHLGSQAACDAAVASLAAEPAWDEAAVRRAFAAAHAAVQAAAAECGLDADDLATTLQVATLDGGAAWAGMVGDGAVVAQGAAGDVRVLLAAAEGGYANEVSPLTQPGWQDHLRTAFLPEARAVLLFTDGLTRLLLAKSRQGWQPFAPFFQAFLPQVAAPAFEPRLVPDFLGGDAVDRSWDDDKGLVVLAREPVPGPPPAPPAEPAPDPMPRPAAVAGAGHA